jgi:tRNA G37 N-methylase TrmD
MARGLLIACRNRAPSCRIETVVDMIHRKGAMMREFGPGNRDMGLNLQRYSNPVAFLRVAVPKMFDGDDWKQIEDKERRRQEDLIARARAVLANESDYDEMDRLRAREILREAGLT